MLDLGSNSRIQQLESLTRHLNEEVEQKLNSIFAARGWLTTPQFIFDHSMWVEWLAPDPALGEVYRAKYFCDKQPFLEVVRYQSLVERENAISIVVSQTLTEFNS